MEPGKVRHGSLPKDNSNACSVQTVPSASGVPPLELFLLRSAWGIFLRPHGLEDQKTLENFLPVTKNCGKP